MRPTTFECYGNPFKDRSEDKFSSQLENLDLTDCLDLLKLLQQKIKSLIEDP